MRLPIVRFMLTFVGQSIELPAIGGLCLCPLRHQSKPNTSFSSCTRNNQAVMDNERYLKETALLNYSCPSIQQLIRERRWKSLDDFDKIKQTYSFVRDEILFGYNRADEITAEQVLQDGYGQCNTKGILFMALLRAIDVPCRIHGFTIDKELQKGAMTGIVYRHAPQQVLHSWVEVLYQEKWYELEAFILDKAYLNKLQEKFKQCHGAFCGYGVAVKDFSNPAIDWDANNTYIQSEGINQDFGVYDSPDELFKEHHQEMSKAKKLLYEYLGRHLMNKNVNRIRGARVGKYKPQR